MSLALTAGRAGDRLAQGGSALVALLIWVLEWVLLESASYETKAPQNAIAVAAVCCVLLFCHALIANRDRNLKSRIRINISHLFFGQINRRISRVAGKQDNSSPISVGDLSGDFARQSNLKIYLNLPTRNRA